MIKLNVKERGHVVTIPGITPFRTPAKVDITKLRMPLVIATLNNLGINNYEIVASQGEERKVFTKKDFETKPKRKEQDLSKINERFNKLENMMYALLSKKQSNNFSSEEQITNKLRELEQLSKKILEKEAVKEIVYTSSEERKGPIIEELDDEKYIPDIDLTELELKGGTSSKKIGDVEGAEEAADMLSRLKG